MTKRERTDLRGVLRKTEGGNSPGKKDSRGRNEPLRKKANLEYVPTPEFWAETRGFSREEGAQ